MVTIESLMSERGTYIPCLCRNCGARSSTPMLKDELWAIVSPAQEFEAFKIRACEEGMRGLIPDLLCLPCVEARLGRTVYSEDMNNSLWSECLRALVDRELTRLLLNMENGKCQTPSPGDSVNAKPVAYQYRTFHGPNTVTHGWTDWEPVVPRNVHTDTVEDRVREIQYYIDHGYKYELRALYVGPMVIATEEKA